MESKPLVSVIMGIYNCALLLPTAIESIISQTYDRWELIMCDDNSTDYTYEVAAEYALQYANITVLRNEQNSRLAYSLNRCLGAAKGTYIARMDADDISLSNRLEIQVEFLNSNPSFSVVGSSLIPFDENGDRNVRKTEEFPQAKRLLYGVPFYHPTIMMRKSVYDDLQGYHISKRTRKGQDLDLWYRFYAAGYKGYNVQEPLLKYRESLNDYNHKRNLEYSWDMTLTKLNGFQLNHFPIYTYPLVFKPIVSAIIPNKVMYLYHKKVK